jgi:hypothetical protein
MWDNKVGDAVQPADVNAAREKKAAAVVPASPVTVADAASAVVVR